jgi:RNA recognition motif-containing protein
MKSKDEKVGKNGKNQDKNKLLLGGLIDYSAAQYRKIFVGGLPHNLALSEFKEYFS